MGTLYADTDFILSLIKEEDWLQSRAKDLLDEHRGGIVTSAITVLETIVVLKRNGIDDTAAVVEDILAIADPLQTENETLLQAAFYVDDGATPFDAFHLAMADDRPIISSDQEFDNFGADRISLEE